MSSMPQPVGGSAGAIARELARCRPNLVQRLNQHLAATRLVSWIFARSLHHLDGAMLRFTGGRRAFTELVAGLPVMTLTTTGAKSGLSRTSPIIGIPDGERIVVIGTNFGQRRNPAWFYNVRANPAASIAYHGLRARYTGQPATEEERERFWREGAKVYVGYAAYLRRAVGREVPIIVLTPRGA